jgi:hypothetical protein
MPKKIIFKIVVLEDGKEKFSENLSYEAASNIVSNFPDRIESNEFFLLAAQHPASTVRENVAYKDKLTSDVVEILANDGSVAVLRNLVRSNAFRETASQDLLEKLISLDVEIAQSIAGSVESFEQADANKLAAAIATHEDPSVVSSLAGNYSTPKKILKTLINHPDPYVASEAKSRLDD